jgi:4-amino-4-deoxy-L-arabinose transferase-like glycosyltransferase
MQNSKIVDNWQWVSLWVILILSTIYSRPLIPIDETRYLSVAWEMWQNNDFLVPHINGQPYSHKPPLMFWLIQLSWFIFGVEDWSGRVVSPLFGLGSVLLTIKLATTLWPLDKDVRRAVPFVLLGTSIWCIYSTLTMFEMLLTFLTLLGLLSLLGASKNKSILPWVGLSLSIGFGILTKGPVVLLYILPPMFFFPVWCPNSSISLRTWFKGSLLSLLAGIGIALCWAIPAALAAGYEYQQAIFLHQTVGRMVKAFTHARPFYWYLLLLPLITLPWFFWFPTWKGWRKKTFDSSKIFCLCAVLPPIFALSLVSGKQLHYVLPVLPSLALLIARAVSAIPEKSFYDRFPLLLIFIVLSLALFVLPQWNFNGREGEVFKYIPRWLFVVPILCGFILVFVKSHSVLGNIKIVSTSMVMLVVLLHISIASPLQDIYDQTVIGREIRKMQEQKMVVAVFPRDMSDQFQFAGRLTTPLVPIKSLHEIASWASKNPMQACLIFTKSNQYAVLQGAGVARPYKEGWLLLRSTTGFYTDYRKWVKLNSLPASGVTGTVKK